MKDAVKSMSVYEQASLQNIRRWQQPSHGWMSKAQNAVNRPLEKAGDYLAHIPGINWAVEKSIGGLVNILNDIAHKTVRPAAVIKAYRARGCVRVSTLKNIASIDLEEVDNTIGWLAAKYKGLATAEGAAAGWVGLPGIPADLVALIAINQRAIGEYATYCGFNVASQQERLYALHVLGYASSPSDSAKYASLGHLVRIARDVAVKKPWRELEKHAFVKIVQKIALLLKIRLTKAKLAQVIPVSGSLIGGGFNAYFTAKVCDAAYHLYRERFLATKYGPQLIS
jgi:hypothetical protein